MTEPAQGDVWMRNSLPIRRVRILSVGRVYLRVRTVAHHGGPSLAGRATRHTIEEFKKTFHFYQGHEVDA